jgi:SAM-dependent methyltransferase
MELDWGCNYIVANIGFGDARNILEIGGGDFSRSIALAERYPEMTFFSVDFFYSQKAIVNAAKYAHLPNLNIIKGDAVSKLFVDGLFDFAFSIDVGEHISNLNEFIVELHRILKIGGRYFFIQNPFWTSQKGHHYKHWLPDIQNILSGYKHIIYSKREMVSYLEGIQNLPFDVDECVTRIYERLDLSRLSFSETQEIFANSNLHIEEWTNLYDDFYDINAAMLAVGKAGIRFSLDDFNVKASIVSCLNVASRQIICPAEAQSSQLKPQLVDL